jgi:hypothetical protein
MKKLPYDPVITEIILAEIEYVIAHTTNSSEGKIAIEQMIKVIVKTDRSRTTNTLSHHNIGLSNQFVESIWCKIVNELGEAWKEENQGRYATEPFCNEFLGLFTDDEDEIEDENKDEDDFDPFEDSFYDDYTYPNDNHDSIEDTPPDDPTNQDNDSPVWTGFNITLRFQTQKGLYFLTSYLRLNEEGMDLKKMVMDFSNSDEYCTGENKPDCLEIIITTLTDPILTKRF